MTWNRKTVWIVIGAIVLLIVAGFGLYRLSAGASQRELRASAANLLSAESLHTKTEFIINLPKRSGNLDRPFTLITTKFEGDVKQADDSTPEFTGTLLVEARGRGNVFFADGDMRILRDEVLFNLENLPVFLNPTGSLVKKWTRVEASLLKTNNGEAFKQALAQALAGLTPVGEENVNGESLTRFSGSLTAEQEEQLFEMLQLQASGNPTLHQVARLLQANNVKSLEVWVDGGQEEIRRLSAHFVRPLSEGREFDFATLTLEFSDYGKEVSIDRPETKLRVRPDVFARIFGTGQAEEIKSEESGTSNE